MKTPLAGILLAASLVVGHPGAHEEIYQHAPERRDLNHCSKHFGRADFVKRTVEIAGEELLRLRRAAGIEPEDSPAVHKRDYISVSRINHKTNKVVTLDMDPSSLFSTTGACILMPAVDQGPLYVAGEQIRKDITEKQAGIKMTLAIQVVDYRTCAVVPNAYVDIWSSNSTGIYVGVQGYPGMGDPNDAGMLKGTALRGVQPTNDHGIAVFDTLMPGHYEGRATHIHAIVYMGATKQANNTITGGRAAHIGQIYFDQTLLAEVDKFAPYSSNRMAIVQNTRDMLFMAGANGDDPITYYSLVGTSLDQGIVGFIRFGINQQSTKPVSPAAYWTANGGVMNPNGPVAQMNRGGFGGGGFGRGGGRPKRRITPPKEGEMD